ncbi:MAG: ribose-phosphate pyrophosphokinase [Bacteroidales bacterium]|jgi:ribose-phosphate pyrophosphokinase|nr:ribose-phosphate pyrophosphokinase [Bacteroidales bacterium]
MNELLSIKDKIALVTGRANPKLAENVSKNLKVPLSTVDIKTFKDGEIQVYYEETIRGKNVFIIQPTFSPSDNIIELLMLIDAAKRASAASIIAVVPYFGYARQDRKDKARTSIGAKLMANLYTVAGINRLITMDLHQDQIQGFFEIPVDHLYSSALFIPYIKDLNLDNLCIVSPDTGGTKRASSYAKFLSCELAIGYKQRSRANEVDSLQIIGDVKDKNVIIVDDIIDTAGTLAKAAKEIKDAGAKSIMAVCPHALLSGKGVENLENSYIEKLITTDSIPLCVPSSKIEVLSTAPLLANIITCVMNNCSIEQHFTPF